MNKFIGLSTGLIAFWIVFAFVFGVGVAIGLFLFPKFGILTNIEPNIITLSAQILAIIAGGITGVIYYKKASKEMKKN